MNNVSARRLRSSVPDSQISPPPRKRVRLNDPRSQEGAGTSVEGARRPNQGHHEPWCQRLTESAARIAEAAIQEAGDQFELYGPGSLIYLHLKNFQVCVEVSYQFCPALNMIVAPNGSGKSTVISALLLLFGASLITRGQKSLLDYIRVGQKEAEVTVVMRAPEGQQGVTVVELTLVNTNGHVSQNIGINGHRATIPQLRDFTEIAKIHPDNLTQFLPQERVGAFSAATPAERLVATEEAVAGPELVELHKKLSSDGPQLANLQEMIASQQERLDAVSIEAAEVEGHLTALRSRREDMARLDKLKASEPLIRLAKMEVAKRPAELEYKAAVRQHQSILQQMQPQLEDAKKLENMRDQFESRLQESEQQFESDHRQYSETLGGIAKLMSDIKKAKFDLETLKRKKAELLDEAIESQAAARKQIRILKGADPGPSNDVLEESWKHRDLAHKRNAQALQERTVAEQSLLSSKRHYNELIMKQESLQRLLNQAKSKDTVIKERLEKIYPNARMRGMMVEALRIVSTETWNGRVIPPLIICGELALADASPYLPNVISALISLAQVTKFACTDNEDYRKLGRLFGENRITLSVADYSNRQVKTREQIEQENPFGGRQQMKDHGFDGMTIDLIKGPDILISMLCESGNFHRIPYSLTQDESRLVVPDTVKSYATLNAIYHTGRSRYGRQLQFTNVRSIPQGHPNFWVKALSSPLVETRNEARKAEMNRLISEIAQAEEQVEAHDQAKTAAIENEMKVRDESKEEVAHYRDLIERMQIRKRLEERVTNSISAAQSARLSHSQAKENLSKARDRLVALVGEVPEKVQQIAAPLRAYTLSAEKTIEISSTPEYITSTVQTIRQKVKIAQKDALDKVNAAKETRDRLKDEYQELYNSVMPRIRQVLGKEGLKRAKEKAAEPDAQDELQRKIRQLESQLVLTETGFSLADLELQFENLQSTKQELEAKIQEYRQREEDVSSSLLYSRQSWFNSVKSMVTTVSAEFTAMFEAMGYQGRVQLETGNGEPLKENATVDQLNQRFSEWGINILVSFRAGEPLRPLSRMRQSGGEKATSTAVYLLALQNLAKAPFTVLDEINQGMDSHNELAVHEYIVERTCQASPSQCLLVTPKLLPGLVYREGVKIHVIIGGAHVVKDRMTPRLLD